MELPSPASRAFVKAYGRVKYAALLRLILDGNPIDIILSELSIKEQDRDTVNSIVMETK